ncbi:unnamed protein product [Darwinula stevensoni]|uniref:Sulfotransferase domain-containing protein n=1 Tax=Darwinula stevensoni TaxID=69355 RepID=A0A7R8XBZ9_9CRUS|nr:unnamed protein product [Darwinula stevensoni]CAG0887005.1 unnamed protein product [Darwinula stevensoni]
MTLRQTVSPPEAQRLISFPSRTAFDRISSSPKFQSRSGTDTFSTLLPTMASVEEMDEARGELILENFKGYTHPPVLGKPRDWILPVGFQARFREFLEFPLYSTDVFLLGHPKTGTTWVQEMIWLLKNDCDVAASSRELLLQRFPHIELDEIIAQSAEEPFIVPRSFLKAAMAEQLGKSGRLLKSHLPFAFLPPFLMEISKVVYIARNPYDVVVSYYYHMKKMHHHEFQGKISDFVDFFVEGNLLFSPFHQHVLDAWERRDSPNLHFLFYEDLKKDLRKELGKLAEFLDHLEGLLV